MIYKKTLFCAAALLVFMFISCNDNIAPPTENILDDFEMTWYVPGNFASIQAAIDDPSVTDGDEIIVGPGEFSGAYISKSLHIRGSDNTIINSGPVHGSGMIMGFRYISNSSNGSISNLTFTTDLSIMNGNAVDNIEISHCKFINSVQAISNWGGCGWKIHHNRITDLRTRNGGGIGILIADYTGSIISGNDVSHNIISGNLHLASNEQGGYSGTGIVLYADFRWGRSGADEIKNNFIKYNKISLASDNPSLVDVWAFELTDTRDNPVLLDIFDNAVVFNDFRGTTNQIAITPTTLDTPVNDISRNLGENRGHGSHPNNIGP